MRRLFGGKRSDLGASKKTDDPPEPSSSTKDWDKGYESTFKTTGSRLSSSDADVETAPTSSQDAQSSVLESNLPPAGYEAAIAAAKAAALRGSAPKVAGAKDAEPSPSQTFRAASSHQGVGQGVSRLKHGIRLSWRALMLSKVGRAVVRLVLLAILLLAGAVAYRVHQNGGIEYLQGAISSRLHSGGAVSETPAVTEPEQQPLPTEIDDSSDLEDSAETPTAALDVSSEDAELNTGLNMEKEASEEAEEELVEEEEVPTEAPTTEEEGEQARLRIEEHFQEAIMWRELDEKMGNLDQDNQEPLLDQGEDELLEEGSDWKSGYEKAMSDEYKDANIRIIDGIEFEKVGDDWFPVTTKDPKERSAEEKRIVAFEKTEKAEMRKSRRGQMLDKLIKAGLTEAQAQAVVDSKLKGNLKADLLKDDGPASKAGKKIDRHAGGGFGSPRQNRKDALAAAAEGEQIGGGIGETADERAIRLAVEADKEGDGLLEDSHDEGPQKSWFDRASVRERLDGSRFIDCTPFKGPFPSIDGLSVVPKIKCEQFLWKPNPNPVNGTEEFQAGPVALEAAVMANAAAQLEVQRAPVAPHMWGRCALVGNSGMLRMTAFGRSIDTHDTVLRINQAPITGYTRRVGTRVTHRVFNRLWTRAYYSNQSAKKNKAMEQYPLEGNLTLLITRANLKEYGLLAAQLAETRPDVLAARVSSRACSMAQPLLEGFRERLCKQGYGPFKGLNVPSSGWVAAHMLLQLCTSVSVYGFGVEGMQKASRGLPTGLESQTGKPKMANITYHYFQGLGARKEGNDVHSFDTEEKTFEALSNAGFLTFCKWREGDEEHNWRCGCQDPTGESCRPLPLPAGEDPNVDCYPGVDCPIDVARQRLAKLEEQAEQERANGGPGIVRSGGRGRRNSREEEIQREMQHLQELEAQKKFEAEWRAKLQKEDQERLEEEARLSKDAEERRARLEEQRLLYEQQQKLLNGEPPSPPPDPPSPPPPPPLPPPPPPSPPPEEEPEAAGKEEEKDEVESHLMAQSSDSGASANTTADRLDREAERERRKQRRIERELRKQQVQEQVEAKSKEELLALEMAAQEAAEKLSAQEQQAAENLSKQQENIAKARAELQEQAMSRETSLLRAQQALELEAQKREAELQLAAKQKETELQRVLSEQQSLMNMKMQEQSQMNKQQLEEERALFYQEQEQQWKAREAKLVGELNNLGAQYQQELDQRLKQEIALRDQMYQAQLAQKEQELNLAAQKQRETLLQQEAGVLKEREDMWRKQEQELLKEERKKAKDEQERIMAEERARVEAEFAKKATEIAAEHDNLNTQLQQAETALLVRQKSLESELLQRSAELEDIRKMVNALPFRRSLLVDEERQNLMREKADVEQYRMAARKEVEQYMTNEQRAEMEARGAIQREQQLKAWRENELKERQELEDLLRNEKQKSKLVAQAAEKAQKVAEAAIKMGQVEKESARLEAQKEQEKARRAQKEAALMALEAQREAEAEKQRVLEQAHAELEAARSARAEAEKVAQIARQSAEEEKKQILMEAKNIAAQDHKQLEQARMEWEGAMSKASEESEEKMKTIMQEKANEVRRMREEMAQRMAEERKSILTAKQAELDRVALEAEHERERAVKAEKVAEAAIRVGDEEKRSAEVARREAEEEARRAVQRAQKAKGVAEAAIRLGEMEKQAALAAKKEAESALADTQMTYQQRLEEQEKKHQDEFQAREREQEIKDAEEETIPVLEAKLSMLKQFEEEETARRLEEEEAARKQAELQAEKFMERERQAAEKKALREKEEKRKAKEREKQEKWNKMQEREKNQKERNRQRQEEKLFQRARAMDREDRETH